MSLEYETTRLLEKREGNHKDVFLTAKNIKGACWQIAEKSEKALELCKEYSDDPEKLMALIDSIEVFVKGDGIRKYFEDDTEKRQCIEVAIKKSTRLISFTFGMSINDTELLTGIARKPRIGKNNYHGNELERLMGRKEYIKKRDQVITQLLYSILCCCRSDFWVEPIFEDFCLNMGYDSDSRKAFDIWQNCLKQQAKVCQIFTEDDISYLPS